MSVINANLAVLYAQTGMSTAVAHAAEVAPQASVAVSRMLANEMARQERQQVIKSEQSNRTALSKDAEHRNSLGFGGRREPRQEEPEEDQDEQPIALFMDVGNVLNVDV